MRFYKISDESYINLDYIDSVYIKLAITMYQVCACNTAANFKEYVLFRSPDKDEAMRFLAEFAEKYLE
ncbi:MAG TPA: hypothetical protein O0X39_06825 [Methanocorpusculum sp.]|nr:hypothetical protein [Methanocorpusculum sp.]